MNLLTIILIIVTIILVIYLITMTKNLNHQERIKQLEDEMKNIKITLQNSFTDIKTDISMGKIETSKYITQTMYGLNDIITSNMKQVTEVFKNSIQSQENQLKIFSSNLNGLIKTIDDKLRDIMSVNEKKLEEMRQTVDEKLQQTLEKRLTESFKRVSDQLESVYKGIGEMKSIASDVGDLKRVLSNVKQRGVFGELQLEKIVEDILPNQYLKNVNIKNGNYVEFAIKIPSKAEDGKYVLLPVDSKYPREDYERILQAQEKADPEMLKEAQKSLAATIAREAKDIQDKYIDPPNTTDFAILFLPVEGLFAEVLRIPGLFENIREKNKVIITGPTTITAILNSLHMGFRTLAIEKKSNEVWKLLSVIKTEFSKFSEYLAKTKEKLEEAARIVENTQKKTETLGKKLKNVESLDNEEAKNLLTED